MNLIKRTSLDLMIANIYKSLDLNSEKEFKQYLKI